MLVLGSKSPRRAEILRAAGIPFIVRAADIPEEHRPHESAREYVRRLAREKAEAIETRPDANDAARMLRLLAGRVHEVITGICLRRGSREIIDDATTSVRFVAMTEDDIAAYVATGEPMDKAGGYGVQGLASKFIDRIEGDYFNVVGLPVSLIYRHLRELS